MKEARSRMVRGVAGRSMTEEVQCPARKIQRILRICWLSREEEESVTSNDWRLTPADFPASKLINMERVVV